MDKKHKRLLIFGDSYCAESIRYSERYLGGNTNTALRKYFKEQYNDSPSWIDSLSDCLNVPVEHVGESGTGPSDVVWQLTNFLADDILDSNDIVIIAWSQYNRSKDKNYKPVMFPNEYGVHQERQATAAKMYFNYIYNDDERLNVYNASILAVDQLLGNFTGPLFHFFCFDTEFNKFPNKLPSSRIRQTYQPTSGHLCTEFSLGQLCAKYYKTGPEDTRYWSLFPNHMGPKANDDLINYIRERL